MRENRLFPAVAGLLALILLAGCTLPAAPDVTPTPSEEEVVEEGMSQMATETWARATATAAAAAAETPTEEPSPTVQPTVAPTTPPTAAAATPTSPPPTPTPEPEVAPTTAPVSSGPQTYVVQPGDTLYSIARRYGMNYQDLAAHNGIVNPHRIQAGQVLRIPAGGEPSPPSGGEIVYTVQPGENLFRIALRYNMNYHYLASYNGIANPHTLRAGQTIRIPTVR